MLLADHPRVRDQMIGKMINPIKTVIFSLPAPFPREVLLFLERAAPSTSYGRKSNFSGPLVAPPGPGKDFLQIVGSTPPRPWFSPTDLLRETPPSLEAHSLLVFCFGRVSACCIDWSEHFLEFGTFPRFLEFLLAAPTSCHSSPGIWKSFLRLRRSGAPWFYPSILFLLFRFLRKPSALHFRKPTPSIPARYFPCQLNTVFLGRWARIPSSPFSSRVPSHSVAH